MTGSVRRDVMLGMSRFLLSLLFVFMGWSKLTAVSGTAAYMASLGVPLPYLATIIAILAELGLGLLVLSGLLSTPAALLLAAYSIVTAFLGHHYWTYSGMMRYDMWIHFYKNIALAGGFLALAANGPGRFSLDDVLRRVLSKS